jgi:hypothetical protein
VSNWKEYRSRLPWSHLMYYHGICLWGLRDTTKRVTQVFEPGTPECESRVVTAGWPVKFVPEGRWEGGPGERSICSCAESQTRD